MEALDANGRSPLKPVFLENSTPAQPLAVGVATRLPAPFSLIEIPLTPRNKPPRVLIADDDLNALNAWQRSARAQYLGAIDLRVWQPGTHDDHLGLIEQMRQWAAEGWRPDVTVIDLNFDDGGKHGVHYVEELRREPGFAALPVTLATSNQYSDLEQGKLSSGENLTRESPVDWLRRLKPLEPEAILYGKTGDARFLGRIGQGLPEWTRAARRRAWVKLLGQVATRLDGVSIDVDEVAGEIVEFVGAELHVDHAVVRQRVPDGQYKLVAKCTRQHHADIGDLLKMDEVPVLRLLVDETRPKREPVLQDCVAAEEAGKYAHILTGMRLLGVDAVLGSRPVGFIALLRSADKPPFDREVDATYLTILARLLASAIRVSLLRERQTRLLEFANHASKATLRRQVSQHLVDILHDELHHDDDQRGKATVRLLDFGTGEFNRRGDKGRKTDAPEVLMPGNADYADYANVVRSNQPLRRSGKPPSLEHGVDIGSSMCVPLSIGRFALGAVTLEHNDSGYYRKNDEGFVCSAAALAASALERLRVERLLGDMTDFVLRFTREQTAALDERLRNLLHQFSGYSALVDLEAGNQAGAPWHLRHLDVRARIIDVDALKREMEHIYATEWSSTLMGRLTAAQQWKDGWAMFTVDPNEFRRISLAPSDEGRQTADAVLWIRHGDTRPHRALLLMWSFPPPMGESDVSLLGTMAQVFSELSARQTAVDDLVQRNLIGEQAAQIGYVMLHFRHRMRNLTGSLSNELDLLEDAHRVNHETFFMQALNRARDFTRSVSSAFHKSHAYIKPIDPQPTNLRGTVIAALEGLEGRLQQVSLHIEVPPELTVRTDTVIASLIIYSLLENALDAVAASAVPLIAVTAVQTDHFVRLRVEDNGHGISPTFRKGIFRWGSTTKSEGLGSALAYGFARAEALGGRLALSVDQPARGAAFDLDLPVAASQHVPEAVSSLADRSSGNFLVAQRDGGAR